jgi:hypothetical protein
MERIPLDVIINHIIPYTYNIQLNTLLEDIQSYYTIKKILLDEKHDSNIIKHDILAVFYDNTITLNTILHRHIQIKLKKMDYNIIYNFSNNKRFNILFGLFTKEERICFLEYMFRDNGIWIMK